MKQPILVIIPSLNRLSGLADCLASFVIHSTGRADFLTLSGPGGITAALNSVPLSLLENYRIVGLMGDDIRMHTSNWDFLVDEALSSGPGLVHGRDDIQNEKLPTHPFITTDIVRALGFLQHPDLTHFFGDNFWQELLATYGRIRYLPQLHTEHLHFTVGKSPKDSNYINEEKQWSHDEAAWKEIQRNMPAYREKLYGIL